MTDIIIALIAGIGGFSLLLALALGRSAAEGDRCMREHRKQHDA